MKALKLDTTLLAILLLTLSSCSMGQTRERDGASPVQPNDEEVGDPGDSDDLEGKPLPHESGEEEPGDKSDPVANDDPEEMDTTASGDCSKNLYPRTGQTWTPDYNGGKKVTYSSGGSSITYRWDANGVTSDSLEATYYVTWPTGKGRGDHLELKFWGPGHSGGNCCWCMVNVNGDGETGIGQEGPHPTTKNYMIKGKNVGKIAGKKVGIKGVVWPTDKGAHLEGWMDTNGVWEKVVEYDGPCGVKKKKDEAVDSQQIQFRVDSIEPKMHCAVIAE
jgi:hypothetical protein